MIRAALVLIAAFALQGCAAMKPDMSQFTGVTLPVGLQAPDYVPVQIAAFENLQDVQKYCSAADKRQQAAAVGGIYFGCAISREDTKGCLIVVWTNTAHQILGHEVLHCVWTPRAMAGKTAGLPAHFIPPTAKVQP
jgi:hypothetical protein